MEANAPEKIFLSYETDEDDYTYLDYMWHRHRFEGMENIEYVRTDAFIEKAFEFFGEHLWEYIDVKNANCDTLINIDGDKLKEDFKNYMEGE